VGEGGAGASDISMWMGRGHRGGKHRMGSVSEQGWWHRGVGGKADRGVDGVTPGSSGLLQGMETQGGCGGSKCWEWRRVGAGNARSAGLCTMQGVCMAHDLHGWHRNGDTRYWCGAQGVVGESELEGLGSQGGGR
jgi:hypothetical protein